MRGCRANARGAARNALRIIWQNAQSAHRAAKRSLPDEKPASLTVRCLTVCEGRSLVLIRLHTGRTHQIRVQLSERGFPLVGDVKYGGPRCGDGLKLHAVRLRVGEETYTALPPWAGPWRVAHLPPEWEDV